MVVVYEYQPNLQVTESYEACLIYFVTMVTGARYLTLFNFIDPTPTRGLVISNLRSTDDI